MSFGFKDRVNAIHSAIRDASQKVIFFAAASKVGENDRIAWPARMEEVMSVFPTDGLGNMANFSPIVHVNYDNFALPGVNIIARFLLGEYKRSSGTSCSTPVAAGVAALLIDFVDHWLAKTPGVFRDEEYFQELLTVGGMKAAFRVMSSKRTPANHDYVMPWEVMNRSSSQEELRAALYSILKNLS